MSIPYTYNKNVYTKWRKMNIRYPYCNFKTTYYRAGYILRCMEIVDIPTGLSESWTNPDNQTVSHHKIERRLIDNLVKKINDHLSAGNKT